MSIVRVEKHEHNFVLLDTTCINDPRLSFKAKGLHAYLIARPDNWEISVKQLELQSPKDGRDAIAAGLAELVTHGYALRTRHRTPAGRLEGWETVVFEVPRTENGLSEVGLPVIGTENGLTEVGKSASNKDCIKQGLKEKSNPKSNPSVSPIVETSPHAVLEPLAVKDGLPKRARRCPTQYVPSIRVRDWARESFPDVDFEQALEAMRDWEYKDAKTDWDATLRTWIRNEAKRAHVSSSRASPPQNTQLSKNGLYTYHASQDYFRRIFPDGQNTTEPQRLLEGPGHDE